MRCRVFGEKVKWGDDMRNWDRDVEQDHDFLCWVNRRLLKRYIFRSCLTQTEDYVLGSKRLEQQIVRVLKQGVTRNKAGRPSTKVVDDGDQARPF